MTVTQIKTFLTAYQFQSFKSAAATLSLTPSAVSQQMTALETELGVTLFIRKRNSVEITDAAHALYQGMVPISSEISMLVEQVKNIGGGHGRRLTIGITYDQAVDDIIAEAADWLEKNKGILTTVRHMEFAELYPNLIGGNIDVFLILNPGDYFFRNCSILPYAKEPLYLAVRKGIADCPAELRSYDELIQFCKKIPVARVESVSWDAYIPIPYDAANELPELELSAPLLSMGTLIPSVEAGRYVTFANENHMLLHMATIEKILLSYEDYFVKGFVWVTKNENTALKEFLKQIRRLSDQI